MQSYWWLGLRFFLGQKTDSQTEFKRDLVKAIAKIRYINGPLNRTGKLKKMSVAESGSMTSPRGRYEEVLQEISRHENGQSHYTVNSSVLMFPFVTRSV